MTKVQSHYHFQWRKKKVKRHDNKHKSIQILTHLGIPFVSRCNDTHLIVSYKGRIVDFWPMSGTWRDKHSPDKTDHRGIFELLKSFGISTEKKDYGNHYVNPG